MKTNDQRLKATRSEYAISRLIHAMKDCLVSEQYALTLLSEICGSDVSTDSIIHVISRSLYVHLTPEQYAAACARMYAIAGAPSINHLPKFVLYKWKYLEARVNFIHDDRSATPYTISITVGLGDVPAARVRSRKHAH